VGFIRQLPHELVEAFSATLEETRDAQLLIHVIDSSDDQRLEQKAQVLEVLKRIKADEVPMLEVYNKIDLTEHFQPRIERDEQGQPRRVYISAMQNMGLELLLEAISERIFGAYVERQVKLSPEQGALRAHLYEMASIQHEETDDQGNMQLAIRMPKRLFNEWFASSQ
jgi:GTP-binding protein HflX